MWLFKYLACLIDNHSFVDITWKDSAYQYCLRCGQVKVQDPAEESIFAESGEVMRAD